MSTVNFFTENADYRNNVYLLKQHVNLDFFECESAKIISKIALCAGTARKKHTK